MDQFELGLFWNAKNRYALRSHVDGFEQGSNEHATPPLHNRQPDPFVIRSPRFALLSPLNSSVRFFAIWREIIPCLAIA